MLGGRRHASHQGGKEGGRGEGWMRGEGGREGKEREVSSIGEKNCWWVFPLHPLHFFPFYLIFLFNHVFKKLIYLFFGGVSNAVKEKRGSGEGKRGE